MDARVAIDDLQQRTTPLESEPVTPRRVIEAFVAHCRQPVTFEGGENVDDWAEASIGIIDNPRTWYPESTRPEAGSPYLSLSRVTYLVDENEEYAGDAGTFCEIVLPPATRAQLPHGLAAAAPAGHRLTEPDQPGDIEGPGTMTGYVTTLEEFATSVLQQLGALADELVTTVKTDGMVPDEPPEASPE